MLPAYAGMIPASHPQQPCAPRAPRIRGDDPPDDPASIAGHAVLPAYAGMIPAAGGAEAEGPGAPRIRGDDPS